MSKQAVERVLQLFDVLAKSSKGLSRDDIRWSLKEYREAPSVLAFERMFERDKATLRGLGLLDSSVNDDGVSFRYVLKQRDASEVRDRLTRMRANDSAVLMIAWAMLVARNGSFHKLGDSVLSKLGWSRKSAEAYFGSQPSLLSAPDSLLIVLSALARKQSLQFLYQGPNGDESLREMYVQGIGNRFGRWYVACAQSIDGKSRIFRLDRMSDLERVDGLDISQDSFSMDEALEKISDVAPLGLVARSLSETFELRVVPAYSLDDALYLSFKQKLIFLSGIDKVESNEFRLSPRQQKVAHDEQKSILKRLVSTYDVEPPVGSLTFREPPKARLRASTDILVAELISLIHLAMENPGITCAELSRRTGVSPATVKKRLSTLWVNLDGSLFDIEVEKNRVYVRGVGEALHQINFSPEEEALVLLVLKFLESTSSEASVFQSTREFWRDITDSAAQMDTSLSYFPPEGNISEVKRALREKQCIEATYRAGNREEMRTIQPYELFQQHEFTYLSGFCFQRQAPRVFRVDRLSDIHRVSCPSPPADSTPLQPNPQQWIETLKQQGNIATCKIAEEMTPELKTLIDQSTVEVAHEDSQTIKIAYGEAAWIWDLVLKSQGSVEVLEPTGLRNYLKNQVKELSQSIEG